MTCACRWRESEHRRRASPALPPPGAPPPRRRSAPARVELALPLRPRASPAPRRRARAQARSRSDRARPRARPPPSSAWRPWAGPRGPAPRRPAPLRRPPQRPAPPRRRSHPRLRRPQRAPPRRAPPPQVRSAPPAAAPRGWAGPRPVPPPGSARLLRDAARRPPSSVGSLLGFACGAPSRNYLQFAGLLGLMGVLRTGVDLELPQLPPGQPVARQHPLHRPANDLLRPLLQQLSKRAGSDAAGVAAVPPIALVLSLVAGDGDLLGVHDDDEVTDVDVGGVVGLALAAEHVRD